MNSLFKYTAALSAALMLSVTVTFAENVSSVNLNEVVYSKEAVTVSGGADEGNLPLTIRVAKPDTNGVSDGDVFYISEMRTEEDGGFSKKIPMDDEDNGGIYTVFVGGRGITGASCTFHWYPLSEQQRAIAELDAISGSRESEFYEMLTGEKRTLFICNGFLMEQYEQLPAAYRQTVYDFFSEQDVDSSNAAAVFNRAVTTQSFSLKDADSGEAYAYFMKNSSYLDIETGKGSISAYLGEKNVQTVLEQLLEKAPYDKDIELDAEYEKLAVLYAYNHAQWKEMEELIEITGDFLGLDRTYGGYSSKKGTVWKAMVQNYGSCDEINKAFDAAVSALSEDKNKTGGSSSGSGGSRGASSEIKMSAVEPTEPVKSVKEPVFADLYEADWAKDYIEYLAEKGIVSGDADGNFRPNDTVRREEFIKMAVTAFHYSNEGECKFLDVQSGAWYYPYICRALAGGIVSGVSEEEFGIGSAITRQDLVTILYRCLKNMGINAESTELFFSDSTEIAEYAREGVSYFASQGIVKGTEGGNFAPRQFATRAEVSKIFALLMQANGR